MKLSILERRLLCENRTLKAENDILTTALHQFKNEYAALSEALQEQIVAETANMYSSTTKLTQN